MLALSGFLRRGSGSKAAGCASVSFPDKCQRLLRGRMSELCQIDGSRRSISLFSVPLRFKVNLEYILGEGGRVPPERQGGGYEDCSPFTLSSKLSDISGEVHPSSKDVSCTHTMHNMSVKQCFHLHIELRCTPLSLSLSFSK